MGTWGSKNLENDSALNIIDDESHKLVQEIIALSKSDSAAEYDEYDHDLLFVRFEQLFALNDRGLISAWPPAREVVDLKASFLVKWNAYREEPWPDREKEISATFDRFVTLCDAEEKRVAELPPSNVFVPPSVEEVLGSVATRSVAILSEYQVELPIDWQVNQSANPAELPMGSVLGELNEHCNLRFDMQQYDAGVSQLRIEELAIASGLSLEREVIPPGYDPYLLLARLVGQIKDSATPYDFCFTTESQLKNFYAGQGDFISGGPTGIDIEGFDFLGCESFRHLEKIGELRMEREIFFHKLSESEVLVLEIGGCQDNSDDRKDQQLVSALVETFRQTLEE